MTKNSKGKKLRSQPREKDPVLNSNECEKLEEDKNNAVDANVDKKIRKDQACQVETKVCTKDQGCQTEGVNELKDLRNEIVTLKKAIESLRQSISEASTKPKFDIVDYKHSDEDISFYTDFSNFNTLLLCFDLFKVKAANLICYSNDGTTNFDPQYKKPGTKRKLTIWQEFTMVLLRLRLGLFEERFS